MSQVTFVRLAFAAVTILLYQSGISEAQCVDIRLTGLDVDGNGRIEEVQVPTLPHFRGDLALVSLYVSGATRGYAAAVGNNATRVTDQSIYCYLNSLRRLLDIDGDRRILLNTDVKLLSRYYAGARGANLVAGAIGLGAIRKSAVAVTAYIRQLNFVEPQLKPVTAKTLTLRSTRLKQ